MASEYSPNLRIELIGTGDQSGIWGDTTNNNLGDLIEQAITGVESIPMLDDNYTLSALNGSVDEARNAVIVMTSVVSLTASRDIFIPAVDKLYIIKNSTTGGQNLVVKTSGGAGVTVPNGQTVALYCDGVDCFQQATYFNTPTLNSPTMTGTPVAPTAGAGTNTTQVATTAFVTTAVSNAFPTGTRLMFAQASAPTGWTQITGDEADNRMLRVVNSTGAGTGGSASPILNTVVPAHTHSFTTGGQSNDHSHSGTTGGESQSHQHYVEGWTGGQNANHSHSIPNFAYRLDGGGRNGGDSGPVGYTTGGTYGASNDHAHYFGNWSGGINQGHVHGFSTGGASSSHTHSGTTDNGSSQTNWAPRYIDMILCSKN